MRVTCDLPAMAERTLVRIDEQDDRLLGQRLARGDERAFEEVVRRYGPEVSRLARRLCGWRDHEAEDTTQEVFVRVYLHRKSFRSDSSLKTWLMRITINCCRSLRRRKSLGLDVLWRMLGQKDEDPADLERQEAGEQVREAVRRLPRKEREVVVLYYLEEMPADEVATLLELTPGAVNVRLHRARVRLESMLAGIGGFDHA